MTAISRPQSAHLAALLRRSTPPPLVAYCPAGFPNASLSTQLLERAVREGGAEIIELGIPCAAPHLDGEAIEQAHAISLRAGTAIPDVLAQVQRLSPVAPVVIITYAAPVLAYGLAGFAREAAEAGAAAVMIVDLPEDEVIEWHARARAYGLLAPRLLSRTAHETRLVRLAALSTGWLYIPATHGPTGFQGRVDIPALTRLCADVRSCDPPPLVIGGGISRPGLAGALAVTADGLAVGSPLVRAMLARPGSPGVDDAVQLVADFTRAIRAAASPPRSSINRHRRPTGGR